MYSSDRMMRNMLQSMGMAGMPFDDPFTSPAARGGRPQQHQDPFSAMMPFGMGFGGPMSIMSMMGRDPFQGVQQAMMMSGGGNGSISYCSSSVTSYTTDEHGRPQVYQRSSEVKQGPDGLKETKSAVKDSRTGHQELAIGHHLHDKAHIKKKSKNAYTGEEEQAEDFVNLEEEEAEAFEQNWRQKAESAMHHQTYSYPYHNQLQCGSHSRHNNSNRLALTSSAQEDHHQRNHHSHQQPSLASPKRLLKSVLKKKKKTKGDGREAKV